MRPPPSARSMDFESVPSALSVDIGLFAGQDQGLRIRPDSAHHCPGLIRAPISKLRTLSLRRSHHVSTWKGGQVRCCRDPGTMGLTRRTKGWESRYMVETPVFLPPCAVLQTQ